MPVLPSYRNHSIDLDSKSFDRFLYEGNAGIEWVNNFFWLVYHWWTLVYEIPDNKQINIKIKTKKI